MLFTIYLNVCILLLHFFRLPLLMLFHLYNKCILTFLTDKIIRHRACTLKDTAHAIIAAELDPEFNKLCEEIKEARIKRGKL